MGELFKLGGAVRAGGADYVVGEYLGGGGQGEVYRATSGGRSVALKWYFPHQATAEQREAIEFLVRCGPPDERFLWPSSLATSHTVPGFGYVMPLRDPRYVGIADLMLRRTDPRFRELATVGMRLAESYFKLHARGLCYCDISFGNVFFDPATGDVLICDNDNVMVNRGKPRISGTMRFMAPEVVRNEATASIDTDRFSLAVLLFYLLMVHHPLEGAREFKIKSFDQAAMRHLYGDEPVFIFDPTDESNRPVPGYQDNALAYWGVYPTFLKNRFVEAFTAGLRDPSNGRVVETIWRRDMLRLRDSIIYCPAAGCGAENFYDLEALRADARHGPSCWRCGAAVGLPFRMRPDATSTAGWPVMLNFDTTLYPHHLDPNREWDFSMPAAVVSAHPTAPSTWGLKNLTTAEWTCELPDGRRVGVGPGRTVTLQNGLKLDFGTGKADVRG